MIRSKKVKLVSFNKLPYYFSVLFISFCFLISIFCYFIIPDKTANANTMNLSIQSMKPGFSVRMLTVPNFETKTLKSFFFGLNKPLEQYPINDYWFSNDSINIKLFNKFKEPNEIKSFPLSVFDMSIDSNVLNNVQNIRDKISNKYITQHKFNFGTDLYGRDLFSRVLLGTRVSLSIGIMAVIISTFLGLFFGSLGGYYGGIVDKIVVYIINVFWSIPTLLLVIAISLSLGKGFWQVYIAIGFSVWVDVARLVRGKVISEKNKDYISASRILGFNNLYFISYHIIPNILGPLLIIAAANFASSILLESGLSFLGIGTQPPLPSWGYMIKENYQYIILGNAYLALIPAIFLVFLVSSFMFLSNYYSDKKI